MGKNNRARRAAKARARSRVNPHASTREGTSQHDHHSVRPAEQIARLLLLAPEALAEGNIPLVEQAEIELCRHPIDLVHEVAGAHLCRVVGQIWRGGWQPAELLRDVRRRRSANAADLVRWAVAADHIPRERSTLDARWAAQIDALPLPAIVGLSPADWMAEWGRATGIGALTQIDAVIELLAHLSRLPAIEELIPPPGGSGQRHTVRPEPRSRASEADRTMLDRIRALLAKAESTTYEAEAEAFTSKAQELMTRHAIDAAVIASGRQTIGESPIAVRIAVDDPYVDAKSVLLSVVAKAGRCQAVFFPDLALSSVVGFTADLAGVELLYTSLLVQAQTSLTNAARSLPAGSRQRSRGFRSSFLLAYANRIGERLAAVNAEVIADVESSSPASVLPVLRSREVAVIESVEARYGPLRSSRVRGGHDAAGWASGRRAADEAKIIAGALPAG